MCSNFFFSGIIFCFLFLQRLEALRKAYADVILNMSKESAARVMAAEMKAQQMERETQRTKDEASQVMARLKKKMDDAV